MRVRDASKRFWYLRRRFAPWRRVVQPYNIGFENTYFRYEVPAAAPTPIDAEQGPQPSQRTVRRERRRAEREAKLTGISGWEWLWKLPLVLVLLLVMIVLGQVLEVLLLLLWFVLFAVSLVEMAAQVIVGVPLLVARVLGLAASRVDVFREQGNHLTSLTVLRVSGHRRAGKLRNALVEHRRTAATPFDPVQDPHIAMLLRQYDAEVVSHDSRYVGLDADWYAPPPQPRHSRA
ncbi:hypothetical protein ACWIGI_21235 [Nocardia sp. NPDC055321]